MYAAGYVCGMRCRVKENSLILRFMPSFRNLFFNVVLVIFSNTFNNIVVPPYREERAVFQLNFCKVNTFMKTRQINGDKNNTVKVFFNNKRERTGRGKYKN